MARSSSSKRGRDSAADAASHSGSKKLKFFRDEDEDEDEDHRPECKYGSSCYRKNAEHFKQFRHAHLDNKDPEKDGKDMMDDEEEDEEEEEERHESSRKSAKAAKDNIMAYFESPDGTQYWKGSFFGFFVVGEFGPVGYPGESLHLDDDDNDKLKSKFLSLVAEKERAGWIKKEDPFEADKNCDDLEKVYLISINDPPHLYGYTYFMMSHRGHLVSSEYGTLADDERHRFERRYRSVTDARAAYQRWLHKKFAQGFKQIAEPKRHGGKLLCPWGCPYMENAEHVEYYVHIDPDIAAQFDKAQAKCPNPVLVDAWNIIKPHLIITLRQHTPILQPLAELIAGYCESDIHASWKPVTVKQKDVPITRSKIAGRPYLVRGEKWPCCGGCKKPMQMWLQLNVSELPGEAQPAIGEPDDMIQLFTCINDDMTCGDNYETFSKGNLVRRIKWTQDGGQPAVAVPVWDPDEPFAVQSEKLITGWTEQKDRYDLSNDDWFPECGLDEDLMDEHHELVVPNDGDKLCGFPKFSQSPEYPLCPKCHPPSKKPRSSSRSSHSEPQQQQRMRYLMTIDSEDQVMPHMLGDCGSGQIYYCEKHPDVLAWGWACG